MMTCARRKISLLAFAFAVAPTLASSSHCPPGVEFVTHGQCGAAHHHRLDQPMHKPHGLSHHPQVVWRGPQSAAHRPDAHADRQSPVASAATDAAIIADTAGSFGHLNERVEALKAAGGAETFGSNGPSTVSAPSDEAFAKIPQKIRKAIIADTKRLAELTGRHAVTRGATAADVVKLKPATTAPGSAIMVDTSDGVMVYTRVLTEDIRASNGVILVIDPVLIPRLQQGPLAAISRDTTTMSESVPLKPVAAIPAVMPLGALETNSAEWRRINVRTF